GLLEKFAGGPFVITRGEDGSGDHCHRAVAGCQPTATSRRRAASEAAMPEFVRGLNVNLAEHLRVGIQQSRMRRQVGAVFVARPCVGEENESWKGDEEVLARGLKFGIPAQLADIICPKVSG